MGRARWGMLIGALGLTLALIGLGSGIWYRPRAPEAAQAAPAVPCLSHPEPRPGLTKRHCTPTPTPAPTATPTPTPTATATATPGATGRVYWGAYIKGSTYDPGWGDAPWDARTIARFEQDTGKGVSIMHWGEAWQDNNGAWQPFYPGDLDLARAHGSIPMLNWNPWRTCCGPNQPAWRLAVITSGAYDPYIRQWAAAAAAWGHPFFLRMGDEMNGRWYPWAEAVNGNAPGDYVAMWRHVHDLFTQAGATNVTWVWSPNAIYAGSTPLAGLYPGATDVDWTAIDGYNWGGGDWQTFAQVVGPTYTQIQALAPSLPLMVAETASSEAGGSKASWITDALTAQIPTTFPRLRALVWFNWNADGMDWVVETSSSSQAAFAAGIGRAIFTSNTYQTLSGGKIAPP